MEKYKKFIERIGQQLDQHWLALPRERQRRIVLYCFSGYLLLTLAVIVQLCSAPSKQQVVLKANHLRALPLVKTEPELPDTDVSTKKQNHEK